MNVTYKKLQLHKSNHIIFLNLTINKLWGKPLQCGLASNLKCVIKRRVLYKLGQIKTAAISSRVKENLPQFLHFSSFFLLGAILNLCHHKLT